MAAAKLLALGKRRHVLWLVVVLGGRACGGTDGCAWLNCGWHFIGLVHNHLELGKGVDDGGGTALCGALYIGEGCVCILFERVDRQPSPGL